MIFNIKSKNTDTKIIAFPFAGGNKYSYTSIKNRLEKNSFEVFDYSRGDSYLGKGLNYNVKSVVKEAINFIESNTQDNKFIIYGHSLGALLAYLVCQKLQEKNMPMPCKLVVSGKEAPKIIRKNKIAHLPNDEFWTQIISLGGIPKELQTHDELIDYFLPNLRQDFKLVEEYKHKKKPKLNIPIDVFYGSDETTKENIIGWIKESKAKVTITELSGNHFFIYDHIRYFQEYFKNELRKI